MRLMSWNARKYYDEETRNKLQEAIPDEQLLAEIISAYEDSMSAVDRKEAEIRERYESIASLLRQTSEASGVSQEMLIAVTRRIAVTSRDTEWYQVLSMINSFFRVKDSMEKEQRKGK